MAKTKEMEVLQVVREAPASIDTIAFDTGLKDGQVSRILRKLCHDKLCVEMTGADRVSL